MTAAKLTVILAVLMTGAALCETSLFVVERDPFFNSDGQSSEFTLRDGMSAPRGLRVQLLSGDIAGETPAPCRDAADGLVGSRVYGVHTPDTILEYMYRTCTMGEDTLMQGYPAGPGCVTAMILGDDHWYGWIRAFSCSSIVSSAYYADTPARQLAQLGKIEDAWDIHQFVIDNVNPAYRGIEFDVTPIADVTDACRVEGSVTTTPDGGNNLLANDTLSLQYSTDRKSTRLNSSHYS